MIDEEHIRHLKRKRVSFPHSWHGLVPASTVGSTNAVPCCPHCLPRASDITLSHAKDQLTLVSSTVDIMRGGASSRI